MGGSSDCGSGSVILGRFVEILLNLSSRNRIKRSNEAPTPSRYSFVRRHVVGTDGDEPGVTDFHLRDEVGLDPRLGADPSGRILPG